MPPMQPFQGWLRKNLDIKRKEYVRVKGAIHKNNPPAWMDRASCGQSHPQKEGPGGYKLSRSDDEGDAGRDGVSGSERNLQEADSA